MRADTQSRSDCEVISSVTLKLHRRLGFIDDKPRLATVVSVVKKCCCVLLKFWVCHSLEGSDTDDMVWTWLLHSLH